jgi:hypothetical protein
VEGRKTSPGSHHSHLVDHSRPEIAEATVPEAAAVRGHRIRLESGLDIAESYQGYRNHQESAGNLVVQRSGLNIESDQ